MQKILFDEQEKSKLAAASFPEVSEVPVSWGEINLQRADKYKAIVNPESGKVYSIVSKDYKLIRHEDAVRRIESAIDENLELGKYKSDTKFYNDGARMRGTYRFYEKSVEIKKGDKVNPELHLFNSYDTTWPFIILIGAFRFVCANCLVVGDKYLYLRKRHVYHIDHIRPVSSFYFTKIEDKEFKECWALSNLQPLWASENCSKGAKFLNLFEPPLHPTESEKPQPVKIAANSL